MCPELGMSRSLEWWYTGLPFAYAPGRKGLTESGMEWDPVWFWVSAKSMEGLEERRPSPGDLGRFLLMERVLASLNCFIYD